MTYLESIKEQNRIRKKEEEDALRVKMLIIDINNLHNVHNGKFLDDLEIFLKNYKQ